MADGTVLNPGVGGDTIVTEQINPTGQKIPVSKIYTGALDQNGGPVTVANPLPIGGQDSQGNPLTPTVAARNGVNAISTYDDSARALLERAVLAAEDTRDYRQGLPVAHVRSDAPVGNEQALLTRNIPSGTQTIAGSVTIGNQPTQMVAAGVDVTGLPVAVSLNSSNGLTQLAVCDNPNRLLLEQILLVLIDIRSSLMGPAVVVGTVTPGVSTTN